MSNFFKIFFIIVLGVSIAVLGCKTSYKNTKQNSEQDQANDKTSGVISHKYISSGCGSVIFVCKASEDTLVLIPKDPLPKEFDKDGKKIWFQYHLLKMPNPVGCLKGLPAEISDISIK